MAIQVFGSKCLFPRAVVFTASVLRSRCSVRPVQGMELLCCVVVFWHCISGHCISAGTSTFMSCCCETSVICCTFWLVLLIYGTYGNFNGLCFVDDRVDFLNLVNLVSLHAESGESGSARSPDSLLWMNGFFLCTVLMMMWNSVAHEPANIALLLYRLPTGFSLRADGVVELFHLHCVDDVSRGFCVQLSFGTSLINSSLLTGHSSLACLLVLCRCCLRLPTNCPSTSCPTYRRSVRCWILAELNWTEHGSATMYVVTDSGVCLLVFARLSRCGSCCGPPTTFPLGHRCTVGCPCRDPPVCLDAQGGIKAERQPFCGCWSVVLSLSCGGPNKANVIAPFCSCTCFVFDNNSAFTVIGMREYLHPCSTRALRRSNCLCWLYVLDVLFNEILILLPTWVELKSLF